MARHNELSYSVLRTLRRSVSLFALACVPLAGCKVPSRVEVAPPQGSPRGQFWLLADTQLHNVAGEITRSRGPLADWFAPVAIRPPTVDLWAEVVLSSIVHEMSSDHQPVFFLGDAANISCIDEYDRFLREMRRVSWLGVLGNHDGYYMGNLTYLPDWPSARPVKDTWFGGCARGAKGSEARTRMAALEKTMLGHKHPKYGTHAEQGTLSKTHAAWMYLEDLRQRGVIDLEPLEQSSWKEEGSFRVFRAVGKQQSGARAQLVEVVAAIPRLGENDPPSAWKAYVLQDVWLADGTHALMIDTSDYLNMPPSDGASKLSFVAEWTGCASSLSTANNSAPGVCGEVNGHQLAEVTAMVARLGEGERFLLLGHHPWQALRRDTAERLRGLRANRRFITYVSAHTHYPAATTAIDNDEPWEVNIGSTTDEPMEYARLSYWYGGDIPNGEAVLGVDRRRVRPADEGGTLSICSPGEVKNELNYGEQTDYVNRALSVYAALLTSMPAGERQALLAHVSSAPFPCERGDCVDAAISRLDAASASKDIGPKLDALGALAELDRRVLRWSPWVRLMEQKCAVWASHAEGEKNGEHALSRSRKLPEGSTTFRVRPAHPLGQPHVRIGRQRVRMPSRGRADCLASDRVPVLGRALRLAWPPTRGVGGVVRSSPPVSAH